MNEKLTLGASEAIRIAAAFFPVQLERQRDLAREIIQAINRCEADMASELIRRLKAEDSR